MYGTHIANRIAQRRHCKTSQSGTTSTHCIRLDYSAAEGSVRPVRFTKQWHKITSQAALRGVQLICMPVC